MPELAPKPLPAHHVLAAPNLLCVCRRDEEHAVIDKLAARLVLLGKLVTSLYSFLPGTVP